MAESDARLAAYTRQQLDKFNISNIAENLMPNSQFVKKWKENSKVKPLLDGKLGFLMSLSYPKASYRQYIKSYTAPSVLDGLPSVHFEKYVGWERVMAFCCPYKVNTYGLVPALEQTQNTYLKDDQVFLGTLFIYIHYI